MQVYVTVSQAAPETRTALEKLRATWHGVFADAVLASVARASQARPAALAAVNAWSVESAWPAAEAVLRAACKCSTKAHRLSFRVSRRLHPAEYFIVIACAQAAALPAPQTLPAPYMAPGWQQPAALEPAAYPAYSQPLAYAQPRAYLRPLLQHQPQPAPYQGFQAAPVSPGHYGPPQSPGYATAGASANGGYHGAPAVQPAPAVYAPPQPAPQQPPMLLAPQSAQAPMQYAAQQPQPLPHVGYQPQQPAPLPAPVQLPAPMTLPAPICLPLPAPVTLPAPGPAPAGRGDPRGASLGGAGAAPGSAAPALPDFLASLLQQGLIRVQGGGGGGAAGAGAGDDGANGADESDDKGVPRRRYDPQKLKFLPERIKVGGCLPLPASALDCCLCLFAERWHQGDAAFARCRAAMPSTGLTAVHSCHSVSTRAEEHRAVNLTAASSIARCRSCHQIGCNPHEPLLRATVPLMLQRLGIPPA